MISRCSEARDRITNRSEEAREDDTDHEASLFETGGNLNPDNAYRVSDTHRRSRFACHRIF
jgi:hypothetical protein